MKKQFFLGLFIDENKASETYLRALKGEEEAVKIIAEKEKFKCITKVKDEFFFSIKIASKHFLTKRFKTIEEALFIKQEVLKDFSNLNKYREIKYDLKEEFRKLDTKTLRKNKYYESFKHLLTRCDSGSRYRLEIENRPVEKDRFEN